MPNGAAGLAPNIDLAFALSSDGSIPQRAELDQPTVEELLKQRVRESDGWAGAHHAAFDGLLGGPVALVQNIIATMGNAFTGMLATGWATVTDVLDHIGDGITTFLETLIPGLDASKIISGQFAMEMVEGLVAFVESTPILGDLVEAITGVEDGDLSDLGTFFNNMRNFFGSMDFTSAFFNTVEAAQAFVTNAVKPFADILFSLIRPEWIPLIPLSQIGNTNPNLLLNGGFDDAVSVADNPDFTWDGTQGRTGAGCALTTATGAAKTLYSNQVPVSQGQKLTASAYVKYTSATHGAGGDEIQLGLTEYLNESVVGETMLDSITNPSGTLSSWAILTDNYTVPAGVDEVRLHLRVASNMTGGTVRFDDADLHKTGLLEISWVNLLQDTLDGISDFAQSIVDKVIEALTGIPVIGGAIGDMFDALGDLWADAQDALADAADALGDITTLAAALLAAPATVIGSLVSNVIDTASNTLQDAWDWLTHLFTGGRASGTPATGQTFNDVVTAADQQAQATYNTQFATETLTTFFNQPRVVPPWISNLADDASFAQTLVDGTTAPTLGTLVLIPVTVTQDRVYDAIKFGIAATTMTNCYVGLYDVDETTGTCTKVLDLGDVKSSLNTAYNLQTIPLGTTISVQKGEVYYIAVLQTGGTAAAMHRWSTTFNFTTGLYPRYIGNTYTTTGIGALPSSFNAGTDVISGTKYWGALGTATSPVTPGSAFYSDSFSASMASWTLRSGSALTVSSGRAGIANAGGEMTYNQRVIQGEQEVGATVALSTGAGPGDSTGTARLSLRGNGLGKRVWLRLHDNDSGSTVTIGIYTGTAYGDAGTLRASTASIPNGGGDLIFRAVGNTYTGYLNGVQKVQWIDLGGVYTYDNSYTEQGIYATSNNARRMTIDNWYGKDV